MPQLDVYRQQQTAQNEQRVVRNARPSEAASEVVGETITAAGELGIRIQQARAEQEAANLEIEAGRRYDSLYRELETDGKGDAAEFEKRLTDGSAKLRGELLGKVKSKPVRDAFDLRLKGMESGYVVRTRDLARRRSVEEIKAGLIGRLASLEDTANDLSVMFDDPDNPEARTFMREQAVVMAEIRGMREKGFIGKDDEAVYKDKIGTLAKKADSDRILSEIDSRLDRGEAAAAEEFFKLNYGRVLPEQREKVETVLETKGLEVKAVQTADKLWSESAGDYGAFIAKASQIENVDERLAVEARGAQLKNQGDAAKAAKADKDMAEGMTFITQGRAPTSQWLRDADPEVAYTVQERWRARQEQALRIAGMTPGQRGTAAQVSMGAYRSLKAELNGSEYGRELGAKGIAAVLADPALRATYDKMLPDEQGQFELDLANAAANGGVATDSVSKAYRGVVALASAYMPKNTVIPQSFTRVVTSGLGAGDPGAGKKTEGARMVEGEILRLVAEEVQRTGGADIPEPRARQIIALAYGNVGGNAMTGSTAYPLAPDVAGDIMQTEARRTILDFRSQNPDLWSTTAAMVRSKYPEASDAVVLEEARRIMAYRDAEQIAGNLRGMFGAKEE